MSSFSDTLPSVPESQLEQVAVLPVLIERGKPVRIVLITTRDSGRWTIPKGNSIKGLQPHEAAAREAMEEGGLIGKVGKEALGVYDFWKRRTGHWELAKVRVFPLRVEAQLQDFKERDIRKVQVFDVDDAEENVLEPGLKTIIRNYAKSVEGW